MRKQLLYIITLVSLAMFSCNLEQVSLEFLNPNKELVPDQVMDLKLDWFKEDIPMFEINNEDTTIIFTLTHDTLNVISQRWEVELQNVDSFEFNRFLSSYNSVIISKFNFNTLGVENLTIYNYKRNMIFTGSVRSISDSKYLLIINYNFPF